MLMYTHTLRSGEAFIIPVIAHQLLDAWSHNSPQKAPFLSYKNQLLLPQNIIYQDTLAFIKDPTSKWSLLQLLEDNNMGACMHTKLNKDHSISKLFFSTENRKVLCAPSLYNDYFNEIIREIQDRFCKYKSLWEDYRVSEAIDSIELDTEILTLPSNGISLSKSETECFKEIYSGTYNAKEISLKLNRSPRTIEKIIANLSNKLNCKNKYELVVKVSQMDDYVKHLLYSGLL
ncbi:MULTISPECIES: helix-turn-helix domain-containing protein [Cysteiniphilum]|uniref:helix-turn-helix domain-containing protein n=2 Tax=Fastidiosibacteraceae TaxID=2056687 RepID=UPI0017857612|nr:MULTISPECIES: helix-turn-helix transcriptional regulator [Cysteiniphilum]